MSTITSGVPGLDYYQRTDTRQRRGEFKLGQYMIRFAPLRESGTMTEGMWTRYEIWYKEKLLGTQISVPNEADCNTALRRLDVQQRVRLDDYKPLPLHRTRVHLHMSRDQVQVVRGRLAAVRA